MKCIFVLFWGMLKQCVHLHVIVVQINNPRLGISLCGFEGFSWRFSWTVATVLIVFLKLIYLSSWFFFPGCFQRQVGLWFPTSIPALVQDLDASEGFIAELFELLGIAGECRKSPLKSKKNEQMNGSPENVWRGDRFLLGDKLLGFIGPCLFFFWLCDPEFVYIHVRCCLFTFYCII